MITIFNRKSCFTSFDMEAFAQARQMLDDHKIAYKIRSSSQSAFYNPAGAVKGGAGSFGGQAPGMKIMHEIFVHKNDESRAYSLLKQLRQKA